MGKRAKRCRTGGFTLVEIMIVIMIIGILLTIALPNWIRARETSRNTTCVANMKRIEMAKEQFAMASGHAAGDACSFANIVPDYIKQQPACPNSGIYSPEPIGTSPSCTIADHVLP